MSRRDPQDHRAFLVWGQVQYALRTGKLVRKPCVECGDTPAQAHHPNGYGRGHELDVEWLCRKHHTARHRAARDVDANTELAWAERLIAQVAAREATA